jgi:hypothetical protein
LAGSENFSCRLRAAEDGRAIAIPLPGGICRV